MTNLPRPLKAAERLLCSRLLEKNFPGCGALRRQLENVGDVAPLNDDESIIEFLVPGRSHPRGAGQTAIPVEGRYVDKDGEYVMVLVFIDADGNLYQLERYRFEGEIQEWDPDHDAVTLIGPEPA